MRNSTWLSAFALPAGTRPVTNWDRSTIKPMGTAKAMSTTIASCFGVLIKDVCSSLIGDSWRWDAVDALRRARQAAHYIVPMILAGDMAAPDGLLMGARVEFVRVRP